MKYIYSIVILLVVLACSSNNDVSVPSNQSKENTLLGTWSYIEPLNDMLDVHYHFTFKECGKAILAVSVLYHEMSKNTPPLNEWLKNGDMACFYDSICYDYSLDGEEILLSKISYKTRRNQCIRYPKMCYYNPNSQNYSPNPNPCHSCNAIKQINEHRKTTLRRTATGIKLSTFKVKGVYKYDYEHNGITPSSVSAYGYAELGETGYAANADGSVNYKEPINTAAADARRQGYQLHHLSPYEMPLCPFAYDTDGRMLTDAKGNPLPMYWFFIPMYWNYRQYIDTSVAEHNQIQGGDVIIEDVNHDGTIDDSDVTEIGELKKLEYDLFSILL